MLYITNFFKNVLYILKCLFGRNPYHPDGPRLWDLKVGKKISVTLDGSPNYTFLIKRVYFEWRGFDGKPKFKIDAQDEKGKVDNHYLSDQGIVPYFDGSWNTIRKSNIV